MLINLKIKAGVLPLVLAISLVVAVLCSAAILLTYYHQISILQYRIQEKLRDNVHSGFQYGMAAFHELPEREWYLFDLYGEGKDSVRIWKEPWGVFDILRIETSKGRFNYRRSAMVGSLLEEGKPVLYLEDNRKSMSIAGDALIKGDARLPKAGIRTAYVNRKGYGRSQLVYGKILESEESMPELDQGVVEHIKGLYREAAEGEKYKYLPSTRHSFKEGAPLVIFQEEPLLIKDSLEGKIVLQSASKIVVRQGAYVQDIILLAPKVVIQKGFRGRVQAFATDTLLLEEDVVLTYPSAVGITAGENLSLIEIREGVRVEGMVFHSLSRSGNVVNLLKISENATIIGEVWSNAYVELQGEIMGTLSCKNFYLHTPSTVYENYLFNGKIDKSKLPDSFVGSGLLNTNGKKHLVKWLY